MWRVDKKARSGDIPAALYKVVAEPLGAKSCRRSDTLYWMSWLDVIQLYFSNILKCLFKCAPVIKEKGKKEENLKDSIKASCSLCSVPSFSTTFSLCHHRGERVVMASRRLARLTDNPVLCKSNKRRFERAKPLTRKLIISSCTLTRCDDFTFSQMYKVMYSGCRPTVSDPFRHQYRGLHFIIAYWEFPSISACS